MDIIKNGIYRHYKGGLSLVIGTASHSETKETEVIYIGMQDKTLHIRPLDSFTDMIDSSTPRFSFERGIEKADFELINYIINGK